MSTIQSTAALRMNWIDWLKSNGMFLIVFGHTFPPYNKYIYAFSVPLFFIMSGFLTKQESDNNIFWKKIIFSHDLTQKTVKEEKSKKEKPKRKKKKQNLITKMLFIS